ncbi:MAG: phenylalanine--tRNA ligase subunit beta [Clostridia bacterium]|nr:phenylalanine--tRNA ligase subunit beta [Clostridia bacterium]MBR6512923.1 phenylalanine--tRNA ligase subunit beta [Clostridia bacterium]
MNLSKRWLAEFTDVKAEDRDFAEALTLSGSKVESYEHEGAKLENIVVGQVKSIERHPDSDHLWVCQVDDGSGEIIQIVTGAQNVHEGDFVPVARNKSVIASGDKITTGKLRGVESQGMLCSVAELGLTTHDFPYATDDGIFILGEDCDLTPGRDIRDATGFNDTVVEFEITSNRPDCLSIIGLARETAATYDTELKLHEPQVQPGHGNVNDMLKVDILVPDKCYRYCGAVVENVRVAPSPLWMRERLRACGVRPINNIVDITNYVMLEYGQPMHAFDLRYLKGNHVVVRNAKAGETITTLDGEERALTEEMMVIADEEKPAAVAGVMGGEYSGIMDDTTTIVFESACFNGIAVRRAAKGLGMRTESSARFEKQLNPDDCDTCLRRALELVQLLDAGDVVDGIVDNYASPKEPVVLPFEPEWTNRFIGVDVPADEQKRILEKIGFKVENNMIIVPKFRIDIEHQADISEEIARFYGYNNIPNRELSGVAKATLTDRQKFNNLIEKTAMSCGLSEIQTFSFISPKSYDKIRLSADNPHRNCVVISNPLGEDTSVMRTTAIPSMLEVLGRNYSRKNEKAALYELATVYIPNGPDELPNENQNLIFGMYGDGCDYYKIKGIVEEILSVCGINDYDVQPKKDAPAFHPGRTGVFTVDGKTVSLCGEVHPEVLDNYGIGTRAYVAMIDVEYLFEKADLVRTYKPLPKFPATTRDLAFVVDADMPVLKIEKAIAAATGKILENIELFDVYQGSQVGESKKSVAFNLRFRSAEHTLTDEECNGAVKKAMKAAEELGAVLRS